MAINTGVNVTKLIAYAVPAAMQGVNVTKLNAYVVPGPMQGANVTKLNAYAVPYPIDGPVWPIFTMGAGLVGTAYSESFGFTTGTPTITVSVLSGALPSGLALTNTGQRSALISGTPTAPGAYTFTLQASNALGYANATFTITVVIGGNPACGWTN